MKQALLMTAAILLTVLAVQPARAADKTTKTAEKFPYKCILNTAEIPQYNFKRTFDAKYNEVLFREPLAGYVVVKVHATVNERVKPYDVVSSIPKGIWDNMAIAAVSILRVENWNSERLHVPDFRVHVLFYTATVPKYIMVVTDNSADKVKQLELTPQNVTILKRMMSQMGLGANSFN